MRPSKSPAKQPYKLNSKFFISLYRISESMTPLVLYDLPHLVDLSLGSPETGTVNFNILHAVLHAIVQILNADNIRIELTGTPICKPENAPQNDKEGVITVKEYEIESKGKRTLITRPRKEVDKILVVKKWSADDEAEVSRKTEGNTSSNADVRLKQAAEVPSTVPASKPAGMDPKMDDKINIFEDRIKKIETNIIDIYSKLSKIGPIPSATSPFEGPIPVKEAGSKVILPKGKIQQEQISLKTVPYAGNDQIAPILEEIKNINHEISQIKTYMNNVTTKEVIEGKKLKRGKTIEKLVEPEENEELLSCTKLEESMNFKFGELTSKFISLTDEVLDIEKNLSSLSYQLEEFMRPKGKAEVSIADILKELMVIKGKIQTVMSETSFLMTERERIKSNVDTVTIGLDDVQRNKVDRDEIDELLAEKADYNMLQRKVSIDEFDANKRDYNHNFAEAITAINTKHENLHVELHNLIGFVDTKVNHDEIKDIKINFERRIQGLNSKIEAILSQKDPEAAGTRIKILKDVNCISCSQKVLMKTEEDNIPKKVHMPGHRSMKPFLTYELDNVRKQMKDVRTSRNLHHFENMLKDIGIIADPKARHIVTRYCGGSHTIITAQDRVDRGRCKKLHGAKPATTKCVCDDSKDQTAEKPRLKCDSNIKYLKEADICTCPFEEDTLEKCMSPQIKRCLEIDARRRSICKLEAEQKCQVCKATLDDNQKFLNEQDYPCVEKQDKSSLCKDELEKYKKCRELTKSTTVPQKESEDIEFQQPEEPQTVSKTVEKKVVQLAEQELCPKKTNAKEEENIKEEVLPEKSDSEQVEKSVEETLSEVYKSENSVHTDTENLSEIKESEQPEQLENPEQPDNLEEPGELEPPDEGVVEVDA